MNNINMYDAFSQDYDRFVDWDARLSAELPFLISQLQASGIPNGEKPMILDAACGTGQHAVALAQAGFNCLGADISPAMIDRAQENASKAGLAMTFHQAGFGHLEDTFGKDRFDGLLCLGNSLPHVLDESALRETLSDFIAVLKPGGRLILQNRNFNLVMAERERWMPPQTYHEGGSTWIFSRFYDFDDDGRLTFNIQILREEGKEGFEQSVIQTRLWPMTSATLIAALGKAGFTSLECFGDLSGSAYEPQVSGNLVITARAGEAAP